MRKNLVSFFLAALMFVSLGVPLGVTVQAEELPPAGAGYTAEDGNPYYADADTPAGGAWYAWGRAYEMLGVQLPSWGAPDSWYEAAIAAGYKTGTNAKANAIGVCETQVFFVESAQQDGEVLTSEGGCPLEDAPYIRRNYSLAYADTAAGTTRDVGGVVLGYIYLETVQPAQGDDPSSQPQPQQEPAPQPRGGGGDISIEYNNFPDLCFLQYIKTNIAGGGDVLTDAMIEATTEMDLSGLGIYSLEGIGYFTNLEVLDCSDNYLSVSSLYIWNNIKLRSLTINNNANLYGFSFGFGELPLLETLSCRNIGLYSLDISSCPALTLLDCSGNLGLTYLNVSANTALETLRFSGTRITWMDLSANTALHTLEGTGLKPAYNAQALGDGTAVLYMDQVMGLSAYPDKWQQVKGNITFTSASLQAGNALYDADTGILTLNNATAAPRIFACSVYMGEYGGPTYLELELTVKPAGFPLEEPIPLNEESFPDPIFRQYLKNQVMGAEVLTQANIQSFSYLNLANMGISNLKGIEHLVYLDYLNCEGNNLTALDLSANLALDQLNCNDNSLYALDISANSYLRELICNNNQLANIVFGNNPRLNHIQCNNNQLKSVVGINNLPALTHLECNKNWLSHLDVSGSPLLVRLWCDNNSLQTLNVSGSPALKILSCANNQLQAMDISAHPALENLTCYGNQLPMLELSGRTLPAAYPGLQTIPLVVDTDGTGKAEVDLKALMGLTQAQWNNVKGRVVPDSSGSGTTSYNATTGVITFTGLTDVTLRSFKYNFSTGGSMQAIGGTSTPLTLEVLLEVQAGNIGLAQPIPLDAAHFPDPVFLQYIKSSVVSGDQLTSEDVQEIKQLDIAGLDIADLTGIEYFLYLEILDCSYNQLTALDLSANKALKTLNCDFNQLAALDLSANLMLTQLRCSYNQLQQLDISAVAPALQVLHCADNQLRTLPTASFYSIQELDVSNNQLTDLTLPYYCYSLETLLCDDNQLRHINLMMIDAPSLRHLSCSNNQLTTLGGHLPVLQYLDCSNNQLKEIGIGLNALKELYCSNNQLKELYPYSSTLRVLECDNNQLERICFVPSQQLEEFSCNNNRLAALNMCAFNDVQGAFLGTQQANVRLYIQDGTTAQLDMAEVYGCQPGQWDYALLPYNPVVFADGALEAAGATYNETSGIVTFTGLAPGEVRTLRYSAIAGGGIYDIYAPGNLARMEVTLSLTANNSMPVEINAANFPDEKFRSFIKTNVAGGADVLSPIIQQQTTGLHCPSLGLTSLQGIEFFPNLEELMAGNNQLTQLDISGNPKLQYLEVSNNRLTQLDVSGNTELTRLSCSANKLTGLDLSTNLLLEYLYCIDNQLTRLEVGHLQNLSAIYCGRNKLTRIDLSALDVTDPFFLNPQFVSIQAPTVGEAVEIDLKALTGMTNEEWAAFETPVALPLSNPAFQAMQLGYNCTTGILRLRASAFEASGQVTCSVSTTTGLYGTISNYTGYQLMEVILTITAEAPGAVDIDETLFPDAEFRRYVKTEIAGGGDTLTPAMMQAVTGITLHAKDYHNVENLTGIALFPNLKTLDVSHTMVTQVDVSGNSTITSLDVSNTQVAALDVRSLQGLTELDCAYSGVTQLLLGNPALTSLNCSGAKLTALDVGGCPALKELNCADNRLTALDVSGNTALVRLYCGGNRMGSLDLSHNTLSEWVLGPQLFEVTVAGDAEFPMELDLTDILGITLQQAGRISFDTEVLWGSNASYNSATGVVTVNYAHADAGLLWMQAATGSAPVMDIALTAQWPGGLSQDSNSLDIATFPDAALRAWLDENLAGGTGVIEDLGAVDSLDLSGLGITDIQGLENFANLKTLDLSDNALTRVDIQQGIFPMLKTLDLSGNMLVELNIYTLMSLTALDVEGNQLKKLEAPGLPLLETLRCGNNRLYALDVRGNPRLALLACANNRLEKLDVTQNLRLGELYCSGNSLTGLDLTRTQAQPGCELSPQTPQLKLYTGGGTNATLDMKQLLGFSSAEWAQRKDWLAFAPGSLAAANATFNATTGIVSFKNVSGTAARSLGYTVHTGATLTGAGLAQPVEMQVQLTLLPSHTKAVAINATNFPNANFRNYVKNTLAGGAATLQPAVMDSVRSIIVVNLSINNLKGIEYFTQIRELHCSDNSIPSLDLSAHTQLETLFCSNNKLTSLKVNSPELMYLYATDNQLTALDVSGNPALVHLHLTNNKLASLDITANPQLTSLGVGGNQITGINLAGSPKINLLDVEDNALESLDITGLAELSMLYLSDNRLQQLDLSGNPRLVSLDCNNNRLQQLDFSANPMLSWVLCAGNQLVNLELSPGQIPAIVNGQARTLSMGSGTAAGWVYDLKALFGKTLEEWQQQANITRVQIPDAQRDNVAYNAASGMLYVSSFSGQAPVQVTYWCQLGEHESQPFEMDVTLTLEPGTGIPGTMRLVERFLVKDGVMQGLAPATTGQQLKNLVSDTLTLLAADGTPLEDDAPLGTGVQVRIDGGESLTVKLLGDASGDGAVNVSDLVLARRHILNLQLLEGVYHDAAAAGSAQVDAASLLGIRRQILTQGQIPQYAQPH